MTDQTDPQESRRCRSEKQRRIWRDMGPEERRRRLHQLEKARRIAHPARVVADPVDPADTVRIADAPSGRGASTPNGLSGGEHGDLSGGEHGDLFGGEHEALSGGKLGASALNGLSGEEHEALSGGKLGAEAPNGLSGGEHGALSGGEHGDLSGGGPKTLSGEGHETSPKEEPTRRSLEAPVRLVEKAPNDVTATPGFDATQAGFRPTPGTPRPLFPNLTELAGLAARQDVLDTRLTRLEQEHEKLRLATRPPTRGPLSETVRRLRQSVADWIAP